MGYDPNSTDGGGSGESKHKECIECDGVGRIYENGEPDQQDPDGVECDKCKGTGWLEVSEDEKADYHNSRIDDEAEHANDIMNSKN